jgi:putative oxidoreductase
MPKVPFLPPALALGLLRFTVAVIFFSHGAMRSYVGTVDDFGVFLDSKGFPLGVALAWAITAYELVGGVLLALGWWTRPIALGFVVHQVMGIALVHFPRGWFVVGHSAGGMEYSVLLVAALVVLAATSASAPLDAPRAGTATA